jgi:hypothetical protein
LLSVDQLHVDAPGIGDGLEDCVAGYLGERGSLGLGQVHSEQGCHVERDRLALAVVVGGKDEVVGPTEGGLEVSSVLLGVLRDYVVGREIVLGVDPELGLGQVADVAIGSPDGVGTAQVFLDRLRLRRRLDHHKGL